MFSTARTLRRHDLEGDPAAGDGAALRHPLQEALSETLSHKQSPEPGADPRADPTHLSV
ncbi:hypothetical protein EYF80_067937 [Liparis tanakae]|uniref:Uncharacterized protein n=1 Tax=Liparis tanakae TaxID=230148 RepID=A0A4Z2DZG9_9TELE|nr:hypothetical protein EYF80_067937 [Liparis tanakae]